MFISIDFINQFSKIQKIRVLIPSKILFYDVRQLQIRRVGIEIISENCRSKEEKLEKSKSPEINDIFEV